MSSDPVLDELVHLLQGYDPERIILFGSRARGEADAYSDYDLVVIKQTSRSFLERLQDIIPYLTPFKGRQPLEILVYTPDEFARMGQVGLGWMIKQEGIVVYERGPN